MGCEVVYCEVKPPAHCVSLVIASLSRLAGYTSRVSLLIRIMQVQKISELSMVCVFAGARARRSVYEVESVLCVCVCVERERERERIHTQRSQPVYQQLNERGRKTQGNGQEREKSVESSLAIVALRYSLNPGGNE